MFMRLLAVKVFCYGVIYFLCQVTWCDCEVTWVTRNVIDSFRIGEDGCLKNESVCTLHEAYCEDDGSCLCNKDNPHFRNPVVILNGTVRYGSSYGCITETAIRFRVGKNPCKFRPYQVISNDDRNPATKFVNEPPVESCKFTSAEVKYPNNNSTTPIMWLNETYVQLNVSTNTLYFQWKKSVPALQGLSITIHLCCNNNKTNCRECLVAKVFGTWQTSTGIMYTRPTSTATILSVLSANNASHTIKPTKSLLTVLINTQLINSSPVTTTYSTPSPNNTKEFSDDEDEPDVVVIVVAALAVAIIVLIVIILVAICFIKRRNGTRKKSQRSTREENNGTECVNIAMSYENDYSQSPTGCSSHEVNTFSDSEYAKPDIDTTASEKPKSMATDIARVMINGDMYAVVDKTKTTKKTKQELNYMDPENLGLDKGNPDVRESSQPTEYAAIVDVMEDK